MTANEQLFQEKYPDVFQRYILYKRYYFCKTGRDLNSKDYDTVLIKSLIAYFIYRKERILKPVSLNSVAELLGYKSHTGALYAINRIRTLLVKQSKFKILNKGIRDYFLIFNAIFYSNKFKLSIKKMRL